MNISLLAGLPGVALLLAACQTPGTDLSADVSQSPTGSATTRPTSYSISGSAGEDDLVAAALAHHPSLQATRARVKALEQSAIQAKYLPDPSASITAGQMAETAAGETLAGVGIQQKFPYPGKRSEQALATLRLADAMRAQVEADQLALAERVRSAYWNLFLARRTGSVVRESKAVLKSLRESVGARIAVNKAAQHDLLRLDNEITRLDQRLTIAAGREQAANASLNALLFRPGGSALPNPRAPRPRSYGSASTLLTRAQTQHPEVLAGQARIAAAQHGVQLAKLKKRPNLTAGLTYMPVSGDGLAPSANGQDQLFGTLGFTLPFWKEKNLAAEREAAANLAAEQTTLAATRSSLQQRIESAVATHNAERSNLTLYAERLIPESKQSFDLIVTGYSADQSSFLDVVDAWRQLLYYQLAQAENQARLGKADASLRFSAGLH